MTDRIPPSSVKGRRHSPGGGEEGRRIWACGNCLLRNPQNVEDAPSEKGTPWLPAGVCSLSPGLVAVGTAGLWL